MEQSHGNIELAGETVTLLPERALFWPAQRTLVVADLHWGKGEVFRGEGIPVPDALLTADLERLTQAIVQTEAEEVIVLGDLIHGVRGLTPALIARIASWRQANPVLLRVLRGNHDRRMKVSPEEWKLIWHEETYERGPFLFTHEPCLIPSKYVLSGHLHPTVRLQGGSDHLRLPCFFLGQNTGVLPAFSDFSRGIVMKAKRQDRIFAIADRQIFALPSSQAKH